MTRTAAILAAVAAGENVIPVGEDVRTYPNPLRDFALRQKEATNW